MKTQLFALTAVLAMGISTAQAAPKWIMYKQRPPATATIFGNATKNPTLICRVFSNQVVYLGKIKGDKCLVAAKGKAYVFPQFAVLTGARANQWAQSGTPLRGAYRAGKRGQALYLCKGYKDGVLRIGRLLNGGCYVPVKGKEVWIKNYQFMLNSTKTRADRIAWYLKPSNKMTKAVRGGSSAAGKLFICRVAYQNGWYVGKTIRNKCVITANNKTLRGGVYQVMAAYGNVVWSRYNYSIPTNAAVGGFANNKAQFVCRGTYKDGIHPGRLVGHSCHIGIGKQVVKLTKFNILTEGPARYATRKAPASAIKWVTFTGQLPKDAVQGGVASRRAIYICRGRHNQGTHTGRVIGNKCHITWGGSVVPLTRFAILTSSQPLKWQVGQNNKVVFGGYENGQTRYICKAPFRGGIYPGKVVDNKCLIGWSNKTLAIGNYTVLTKP